MPKKVSKMSPREIDHALQMVVGERKSLAKARELIAAAKDAASWVMVHALAGAARTGALELVQLFIEHGVTIDEDSKALSNACRNGHVKIVEALLEAGAPPDAGSEGNVDDQPDGTIAIFAAIHGNHADVVKALIDGGADVNKVSFAQRTPIDVAREQKAKRIVALLEAAGAKTVTAGMLDLKGAIEANAVERVAELAKRENRERLAEALEHACSWEGGEDCVTAILKYKKKLKTEELAAGLCRAAELGRMPTLRLLLEAGVPIDARNPHQHALFAAADRACVAGVEALLAAGADVDATTYNGKTALHGAARTTRDETGEIVKVLLAAGANPTLRNDKGETPLDLAKERDNTVAVGLLEQATPGKQRSDAAISAAAEKKLRKHVRTTAVPVFAKKSKKSEPVAVSRFGGRPGLRDGEPWPVCEGCDDPLDFFFQLNTSELPDKHALHTTAKTAKLVQFFFCTECEPSSTTDKSAADATLLRAIPVGEVATLGVPPKQHAVFPARSIDSWRSDRDYPSTREVGREKGYPIRIEIDVDERKALENLALTATGTKIGGWPKWLQDSGYLKVGKRRLDQLVVQLDLGGPIPYEYGDGGLGFVLCADGDPTKLGFVWQCL